MSGLVTFGDAVLRFTPADGQRLETTASFDVAVTGPESDAAVTAHRLGAPTTWISMVPDTALGRRVVGAIRQHGVSADVVVAEHHRVGLQFVDPTPIERAGDVADGDRRRPAVGSTNPDDLPLESFRSAEWFFTSAMTPALDERLRSTVGSLLVTAKERSIATAFDLRHRPSRWSSTEASETVTKYFPAIDVLLLDPREAETVLGVEGPPAEVVHHIASEWSFETVILWQGIHGAVAWHDASIIDKDGVDIGRVDDTGTRSAFFGAFLAGRLDGQEVAGAVGRANAAAAVVRSMPGSPVALTPDDVEATLAAAGDDGRP